MRKIKYVMRLKLDAKLSHKQIAAVLGGWGILETGLR